MFLFSHRVAVDFQIVDNLFNAIQALPIIDVISLAAELCIVKTF